MAQALAENVDNNESDQASLPSSSRTCESSEGCRPSSALARGIQIVEYSDSSVMRLNPQPVNAGNDDAIFLLEEYLCPRKLVRLCADDLVRTIHLS